MSILSGIFNNGAKEILDGANKVIDNVSTNDEEKMNAKNELTQIVLNSLNTMQNAQRDVILSETQGSWLQRSWRPILMLAFGFIVVYSYFLGPLIDEPVELSPELFGLLKLGIGGYVIGRSVEKVSDRVTKNTDITFLRKKDRPKVVG